MEYWQKLAVIFSYVKVLVFLSKPATNRYNGEEKSEEHLTSLPEDMDPAREHGMTKDL